MRARVGQVQSRDRKILLTDPDFDGIACESVGRRVHSHPGQVAGAQRNAHGSHGAGLQCTFTVALSNHLPSE